MLCASGFPGYESAHAPSTNDWPGTQACVNLALRDHVRVLPVRIFQIGLLTAALAVFLCIFPMVAAQAFTPHRRHGQCCHSHPGKHCSGNDLARLVRHCAGGSGDFQSALLCRIHQRSGDAPPGPRARREDQDDRSLGAVWHGTSAVAHAPSDRTHDLSFAFPRLHSNTT